MNSQYIQLELLLGERVFALNGLPIGRLEEIRTEVNKGHYFVSEFLVGKYAMIERLAAWSIGRALLRGLGKRKEGYRIRWNQIDLSDPGHPRVLCDVDELLPFYPQIAPIDPLPSQNANML